MSPKVEDAVEHDVIEPKVRRRESQFLLGLGNGEGNTDGAAGLNGRLPSGR